MKSGMDIELIIHELRLRIGRNTIPRDYGFPCFPIYCYYPSKALNIPQHSELIRKRIWDFKIDRAYITRQMHQISVEFFVPKVVEILYMVFGDCIREFVFMCVPAKTICGNELRWRDFSNAVCEECGMVNGFNYVSIAQEGTQKHNNLGSGKDAKLIFNEEAIKGKYVVICDDICSYGKTLKTFYKKLMNVGAKDCVGITLGVTTHSLQETEPMEIYNRFEFLK